MFVGEKAIPVCVLQLKLAKFMHFDLCAWLVLHIYLTVFQIWQQLPTHWNQEWSCKYGLETNRRCWNSLWRGQTIHALRGVNCPAASFPCETGQHSFNWKSEKLIWAGVVFLNVGEIVCNAVMDNLLVIKEKPITVEMD